MSFNGIEWAFRKRIRKRDGHPASVFVFIPVCKRVFNHPMQPHLTFNPKIPMEAGPTGGVESNLEHKGILYRWHRGGINQNENTSEEGIVAYRGTLYALTKSNETINVSSRIPNFRIKGDFSVRISGYTFLEHSNGLTGWNSLFDKRNHWDFWRPNDEHKFSTDERSLPGNGMRHYFSDHSFALDADVPGMDSRSLAILPTEDRHETYDEYARMGIARNTSMSAFPNMLRSAGSMDHTIWRIELNGSEKPFSITVND